ncbi:MAG: NADH:ubiquinone reductase (Na(+)-transporting) subunit F [Roseitalea sp.]|jgi:Na+-transporting NADH:ubiquinone oxidoreductase subunit F|nr:NADH:ubiquinone reductase (Na(+)-transporting) subunit F [Roseitalea sp.]MBO6722204.1 NADH:ubiquinone reductase (Na(+)-transporting) subunit F [Roseitalea sp.]MBO6745005.1 NADH:ubiquinone reductase (Na(+)-transporting) subunit F [Roseitalea sp.]
MIDIVFGSVLLIVLIIALTAIVIGARTVLMPARPAAVTINGGMQLATETGGKLLQVLTDNDILVPSACAGAGTCGLCRVAVTGGGGDPLPTEASRLSRADMREGVRLACQVIVRGDMAVRVADELIGAERFECTVVSVKPLTPLIREIVLQLPEDRRPDLFAGAFMQLTAPPFSLDYASISIPDTHTDEWAPLRQLTVQSDEPVTRAYSISNRIQDTEAGRLVFNIRLALPPPSVPEAQPGIVSSWLFSLKEGMMVEASGPFGTFRAQDTDREIVFIGGGVGMAPLRAMIYEQLERLGSKRKISFWYGARSRADFFYADELNALAEKHDNFDLTVALSSPAADDRWEGATGFIHTVAYERYLRDHPAPEQCEYYLCGPPLMIRAVFAMLDDLGVEREDIYNDDFGL